MDEYLICIICPGFGFGFGFSFSFSFGPYHRFFLLYLRVRLLFTTTHDLHYYLILSDLYALGFAVVSVL